MSLVGKILNCSHVLSFIGKICFVHISLLLMPNVYWDNLFSIPKLCNVSLYSGFKPHITVSFVQEGLAPINLLVPDEIHRAAPGGTGGVKTITNYAPVRKFKFSYGYLDSSNGKCCQERENYEQQSNLCTLQLLKNPELCP